MIIQAEFSITGTFGKDTKQFLARVNSSKVNISYKNIRNGNLLDCEWMWKILSLKNFILCYNSSISIYSRISLHILTLFLVINSRFIEAIILRMFWGFVLDILLDFEQFCKSGSSFEIMRTFGKLIVLRILLWTNL